MQNKSTKVGYTKRIGIHPDPLVITHFSCNERKILLGQMHMQPPNRHKRRIEERMEKRAQRNG
jgi:hypothetical protein